MLGRPERLSSNKLEIPCSYQAVIQFDTVTLQTSKMSAICLTESFLLLNSCYALAAFRDWSSVKAVFSAFMYNFALNPNLFIFSFNANVSNLNAVYIDKN